ncbi:MAG: ABC transporter ATP-binding protein [Pseudomonadota bacterium]
MLEVRSLTKSFRGLVAVSDLSLSVPKGSISALIGPNGAGKTTVFNLITGALRPDSGQVLLDGTDITGKRPDQACQAGIGRTFQVAKPLKDLTVEENVVVGALRTSGRVADAKLEARRVLDLLAFGREAAKPAHELTLPDRKRLEVAKALATKPRILLLDEVMAGLRPVETDLMVETFQRLNRETGLTILLIEHVMRAVMALSAHVTVINHGSLIAEGSPDEVVRNQDVLDCYLGQEED